MKGEGGSRGGSEMGRAEGKGRFGSGKRIGPSAKL